MSARYLLLFSVCLNISVASAQYRRFSAGITYSTNSFYSKDTEKWPDHYAKKTIDYSMIGSTLQYNTHSLLSVACEPMLEKTARYNEYTEYTGSSSNWYNRYEKFNADRLTIPLVLKATLGQRFLVIPGVGMSYSTLLSSSSYQSADYNIHDSDLAHPMNEINTRVTFNTASEFNVFVDLGLAYSVFDRFLVSVNTRFPVQKLSAPSHWDRNDYASYPRPRLMFSVAYQFNVKKDSDYHFSNYSVKIRKTTDGN